MQNPTTKNPQIISVGVIRGRKVVDDEFFEPLARIFVAKAVCRESITINGFLYRLIRF